MKFLFAETITSLFFTVDIAWKVIVRRKQTAKTDWLLFGTWCAYCAIEQIHRDKSEKRKCEGEARAQRLFRKQPTVSNMLKIQMLEQIVTSDNVADDKQHNDAEQSTSRTPINLSPQRNGLVHALCLFSHLICQLFWFNGYFGGTQIWSVVLDNCYEKSIIKMRFACCWWGQTIGVSMYAEWQCSILWLDINNGSWFYNSRLKSNGIFLYVTIYNAFILQRVDAQLVEQLRAIQRRKSNF